MNTTTVFTVDSYCDQIRRRLKATVDKENSLYHTQRNISFKTWEGAHKFTVNRALGRVFEAEKELRKERRRLKKCLRMVPKP